MSIPQRPRTAPPEAGVAGFIQVIFVTMVYGPIAAYLVEAFRQRFVTLHCLSLITSAMVFSAGCRSSIIDRGTDGKYLCWFVLSITVAALAFVVGCYCCLNKHVRIKRKSANDRDPGSNDRG